ncbi:MAG: 2Fe-2S iron-sulfur cluster-binding protein [Phycisphaerales bacterium]|nr:2Fe-2S iron-sulfur cluster-binding protein [Phycisphaerales bacterium]
MPTITINNRELEFTEGQTILEVAIDHDIEIPYYCWHPGLSVVAQCRICLAEVWQPNPRNDNKLEPLPKLVPTCQTPASEGMVIHSDSPKAVKNQRSVMELLLINHPVDCPVCDQAGECYLQDYAYRYGRAESRFEEEKIKQPKKDLGGDILLYSDRCIMCTRCVRFTKEVTGTSELMIAGRGAHNEIDVFPGNALDNPLAGNVVDLCPVGALLDKDFLFQQRVWFLTSTPSIDGITASGDNIFVQHNDGAVHRIKPRTNMDVNTWWISDEIRHGWSHIHTETRPLMPHLRGELEAPQADAAEAWQDARDAGLAGLEQGGHIAVMISPMLSCEDAWHLATMARAIDPNAVLALGPVPVDGDDQTFPGGYTIRAEKAPNARGVRRVLAHFGDVIEAPAFEQMLSSDDTIKGVIITGNYPSEWVTPHLTAAIGDERFVLLMDTMATALFERADVFMPAATWVEKAGTFENADNRLQSFEGAIESVQYCKSEAQIALDLQADVEGCTAPVFNDAATRQAMADAGLTAMRDDVHHPIVTQDELESDMDLVQLSVGGQQTSGGCGSGGCGCSGD